MDADLIAVFDTRLLDIKDPVLIRVNLLFFFRGLVEIGTINKIIIVRELSKFYD